MHHRRLVVSLWGLVAWDCDLPVIFWLMDDRTVVIDIHAGSRRRGSEEAPER